MDSFLASKKPALVKSVLERESIWGESTRAEFSGHKTRLNHDIRRQQKPENGNIIHISRINVTGRRIRKGEARNHTALCMLKNIAKLITKIRMAHGVNMRGTSGS